MADPTTTTTSATSSTSSTSASTTTSSSSSSSKSTTTSSSSSSSQTTTTSSSSSDSSSDSSSTSGPPTISISSSSSSTSSASLLKLPTLSSSYTIPKITVPPNANNPNIFRSSQPSGTVFISVAAVLFFGLISAMLVWLLNLRNNRRNAEKGYFDTVPEKEFALFKSQNDAKYNNPFYSTADPSNANTPLHTRNNSQFDLSPYKSSLMPVSTNRVSLLSTDMLSNGNPSMLSLPGESDHNNRRSLFISPTAELLNSKRRSVGLDGELSNFAADSSNVGGSGAAGYSSVDLSSPGPDDSVISLPAKADLGAGNRRRKVPSMILDDMLGKS